MTTKQPDRGRDAVRTKRALLLAAKDLFGAHGYRRTTLREIGERAGVDPALIARYFGNKAALYISTLDDDVADDGSGSAQRVLDDEQIDHMIARVTRFGPSPVLQAVVEPPDDAEILNAARRILAGRTVEPFERRLKESGVARPRLQAEVTAAALAGIILGRSAGTFETLASAPHEDVVELTLSAIRRLLEA